MFIKTYSLNANCTRQLRIFVQTHQSNELQTTSKTTARLLPSKLNILNERWTQS